MLLLMLFIYIPTSRKPHRPPWVVGFSAFLDGGGQLLFPARWRWVPLNAPPSLLCRPQGLVAGRGHGASPAAELKNPQTPHNRTWFCVRMGFGKVLRQYCASKPIQGGRVIQELEPSGTLRSGSIVSPHIWGAGGTTHDALVMLL